MLARRRLAFLGVLVPALGAPCEGRAQTSTQLWTNVAFDWAGSRHVTVGVNAEPKVLLSAPSGEPDWTTFDVTSSFEYARGAWLDVLGEMLVGRTHQSDDLDSTELTPRLGLRLHLLSNLRRELVRERRPRRRLALRDLLRVEWRNLSYSTDKPDSSTVRLRNRFESLWPINRPRISDNGASYLAADWEWFIPLDDPDERFANRQRIRAGIGYRHSFAWRFEARYVWNRSRNTLDEPFTSTDHAVELAMKRVW
jgi:hypothetical protein